MLTPRQSEVMRLVAQGLRTKAIAHELHIAPETVHCHLKAIYVRLDVDNRVLAVAAWKTSEAGPEAVAPTPPSTGG